jgi:hypothetical protein
MPARSAASGSASLTWRAFSPIFAGVGYFRILWLDARRFFAGQTDLLVIALVSTATMAASYYHFLRIPHVGPEWRSAFELLGRGGSFLLIPLLSVAFLRIPLRELGFSLGEPRKWLLDVGLLYLVMLPLLIVVSRQPDFREAYPYFRLAQLGWGYFLLAQLFQLAFMFGWEFIGRGYLLFGFFRRIGYPALLVQMIPFALMHIGKPELETYGSLIAGLALGVVALRARSFYPCVLLHFAVAATLDLLAVLHL